MNVLHGRRKFSGRARTAVVAVAALGLVVAGGVTATTASAADSAPASATVFTKGYDTSKVVTLTFDLDWRTGTAAENATSKANLETVLKVFKDNGIVGGFGVTGRFAVQNPAEARAIADQGHKVFNHSYSHPDFMTLTQAQRWSQLDQTEAAFRAAGISSAGWFRTPYRSGYMNAQLNRDLALRHFYIDADWTFDTTGYNQADWATVSSRIDKYTVPGAIVVMHVTVPSTDPANLQQIIDKYKTMGYGFVSPYQAFTKNAIRTKYLASGEAKSGLQAPTTAELTAASGKYVQWFQRGRIYWSYATGGHYVLNAIMAKYQAIGTINSRLGMPTSDETAGAANGYYSRFQGGSIYWCMPTLAHVVQGGIHTKYLALNGEAGFLGYPRTDELTVPLGYSSHFEHGFIFWTSTTGAHEVHGAILARYNALGATGGALGAPTSDEFSVTAGQRGNFQHGAIEWNRTTGATTVIYF